MKMGQVVVELAEKTVRSFLGRSYVRHLAKAQAVGLTGTIPDLRSHEAAAILWYTTDASTKLLRRLHEGRARKLDLAFTSVLEHALARLPVHGTSPIYRIIQISESETAAFREKHRSGERTVWSVLASCSAGRKPRRDGNVMFVVSHRTARSIGPFSWHPEEEEVVLLPVRTLLSHAYATPEDGKVEVELEELID